LPATLLTGFGTSLTINTMLTKMSHHYGKSAEVAIPQANGIASIGFVIGTALIGTIAIVYPNLWRLGLLLALPVALILFIVGRDKDLGEHIPHEDGPQGGKLSPTFWISWVAFIACISAEFATSFWAAALLKERIGSSAAVSTVAIVALGTGMGVGRWYGGLVLKHLSLDNQLLSIIAIQFFGFLGFWLSHNMVLSLICLFVVGLGVSMQFALSSIRLIGLSQGRPDLAIGRASLAAGIAIAGAPFLLGLLGDIYGISRAYVMVFVLIIVAFAIIKLVPSHVKETV
jgi:predicted MFS family arabinose efflux permease